MVEGRRGSRQSHGKIPHKSLDKVFNDVCLLVKANVMD